MTILVLVCAPSSVLELNNNLRTLVDTCKLISIINKLPEKKWLFLGDTSTEENKIEALG